MAINVAMDHENTSAGEGGGGFLAPGRYFGEVTAAEFKMDNDWHNVEVTVEVLSGRTVAYRDANGSHPADDPAAQVGKKHKEKLSVAGRAADVFLTFACAAGIYSKEQWKADKDAGNNPEIEETEAIGRYVCFEVQLEAYQGRSAENQGKWFPRVGFRFWNPHDPKVKDVPKVEEYLAFVPVPEGMAASSASPAAETKPAAKQPASQPAATPAASQPAKANKFAGLV